MEAYNIDLKTFNTPINLKESAKESANDSSLKKRLCRRLVEAKRLFELFKPKYKSETRNVLKNRSFIEYKMLKPRHLCESPPEIIKNNCNKVTFKTPLKLYYPSKQKKENKDGILPKIKQVLKNKEPSFGVVKNAKLARLYNKIMNYGPKHYTKSRQIHLSYVKSVVDRLLKIRRWSNTNDNLDDYTVRKRHFVIEKINPLQYSLRDCRKDILTVNEFLEKLNEGHFESFKPKAKQNTTNE